MALYGADVESLRQLAQTFNNKSQVLDNDVNLALKALVSATDWQGSDGDKFKDDWDSVLAPQLRNAAQALAQAGWDLNRNADEQEQASGGGGGAGGVVGSSYGGSVTGSSGSFAAGGIAAGGKFGQQGVHVFGDGSNQINYLPDLPKLSSQYPSDFAELPEHSVES